MSNIEVRHLNYRPQHIAEAYNAQSNAYANFANESFSWFHIERPVLDKNLSGLISKDTKVLDAGCGSGRIVEYLIQKGVSPENIVGIDISEKLIEEARKRTPGVSFLLEDLTNTSFAYENFNLITCCFVLHYLNENDFRSVLRTFYDGLIKSGNFLCLLPHPIRSIYPNLRKYFDQGPSVEETPWGTKIPFFHRTLGNTVTEIIKAGFVIKAVEEPEVCGEAKADPEEYKRYTAYPSRLVILAGK